MKNRWSKLVMAAVALMLLATPASAYDQQLAELYAEIFAPVQGPKAGKQLHLMKPDEFVAKVRQGAQLVMLDVRTPGETLFFTANVPGHMAIPMAELFQREHLAQLPTDRPIVVMCQAGVRATAVTTALRQVGFDKAYALKGGFKGLSPYLGPKEANMPLGPKTAGR